MVFEETRVGFLAPFRGNLQIFAQTPHAAAPKVSHDKGYTLVL